jgi:hypothetical protein
MRGIGQSPPGNGGPFSPELQQIADIANWAAGQARQAADQAAATSASSQQVAEAIRGEHKLVMQHLTDLSNVLQATHYDRSGNGNPDIQRIENVPGRRVPFDELVAIQIDANDTSIRTGTITISQEGPFVAVARYASFLSQYSFQVRNPETQAVANFIGRTNGRWRPVHSAADIMDGILPADVQRLVAFPGTGAPSYSSPALHAPSRSMQFDARITMLNQGSSFPRSNIPVPSSFYSTFINSPFQLGALDFFPRADVIEFRVQPQHVNNPNSGNLFGFGAGGVYPFSDAQFDHHEGVSDPEDLAVDEGDPDPVTRLPTGTLLIGLHGYRIIQPPGAVVNLAAV